MSNSKHESNQSVQVVKQEVLHFRLCTIEKYIIFQLITASHRLSRDTIILSMKNKPCMYFIQVIDDSDETFWKFKLFILECIQSSISNKPVAQVVKL